MATIESLDVGDVAVCTVAFTVGGVATSPTVVTWSVWPPDGSGPDTYVQGVAPEATTPATGSCRLSLPVTLDGLWQLKCEGTGAAEGAVQGAFYARKELP